MTQREKMILECIGQGIAVSAQIRKLTQLGARALSEHLQQMKGMGWIEYSHVLRVWTVTEEGRKAKEQDL